MKRTLRDLIAGVTPCHVVVLCLCSVVLWPQLLFWTVDLAELDEYAIRASLMGGITYSIATLPLMALGAGRLWGFCALLALGSRVIASALGYTSTSLLEWSPWDSVFGRVLLETASMTLGIALASVVMWSFRKQKENTPTVSAS